MCIQQRLNEVIEKSTKLLGTLGKDVDNMVHLNLLATAPAFQRNGFGGALVEAINDIVCEMFACFN